MKNERFIIKDIEKIEAIPTSHQIGLKKVLLSDSETISNITQIAVTSLSANEKIEKHIHPTMDEHYIFISGKGIIYIDDETFECTAGTFILVPANSQHNLEVITDMKFITIGVAL